VHCTPPVHCQPLEKGGSTRHGAEYAINAPCSRSGRAPVTRTWPTEPGHGAQPAPTGRGGTTCAGITECCVAPGGFLTRLRCGRQCHGWPQWALVAAVRQRHWAHLRAPPQPEVGGSDQTKGAAAFQEGSRALAPVHTTNARVPRRHPSSAPRIVRLGSTPLPPIIYTQTRPVSLPPLPLPLEQGLVLPTPNGYRSDAAAALLLQGLGRMTHHREDSDLCLVPALHGRGQAAAAQADASPHHHYLGPRPHCSKPRIGRITHETARVSVCNACGLTSGISRGSR
jgi:hypothetical protein